MVATCATLLLSPAFGFADQVGIDYNHQTNFAAYHTYSWGTVKVSDQLDANRIKRAVDDMLQKDGWQMVPSGGQVTLMATDNIHSEKEAETYYSNMGDGMGDGMGMGMGMGWGGGWGWDGWGGGDGGFGDATTTTTTIQTAHMVIDLFDTKSKHLLWRGVSRGELSGKPEENRKRIYEDIDHMFKEFPPKAKS